MQTITMRYRAIGTVCVAVLLVLGLVNSRANDLTRAEMDSLRGGTDTAAKCTYSCNAYNGNVNICQNPFDPETGEPEDCEECTNGTTSVEYVGTVGEPNCVGDRKKSDTTQQPTDCGKLARGECMSLGVCDSGTTINSPNCHDPFPVGDQPPPDEE